MEPEGALLVDESGRGGSGRSAVPPHRQAQRSAVDGDPLRVLDGEPTPSHQRVESREREVTEMLMINGVELELVDQVANVRDLDDRESFRSEDLPDAIDESGEIRNVRKHVVRVQHV